MSGFLWHFCCRHSARRIGRYGLLLPHFQPVLKHRLIWLTTDREASRVALGLTSLTLMCDRMERLYEVTDASGCEAFNDWMERKLDRQEVDGNEVQHWLLGPDHRPDLWWLSERAVPVRAAEAP